MNDFTKTSLTIFLTIVVLLLIMLGYKIHFETIKYNARIVVIEMVQPVCLKDVENE